MVTKEEIRESIDFSEIDEGVEYIVTVDISFIDKLYKKEKYYKRVKNVLLDSLDANIVLLPVESSDQVNILDLD